MDQSQTNPTTPAVAVHTINVTAGEHARPGFRHLYQHGDGPERTTLTSTDPIGFPRLSTRITPFLSVCAFCASSASTRRRTSFGLFTNPS